MNSTFRSFAVLCGLLFVAVIPVRGADDLTWPMVTSQNKPWVWWWWPGSAVTKADITTQLDTFQDAGLGGVQIIPIYGVKGQETNYINFLTPDWMGMMGYTVS